MTDSSNSSPKRPKLLLIHGMNNNQSCFYPLRDALEEAGFKVELIVLPNHGEKREEVKTLEEALILFDESLSPHVTGPYRVVAFSQGALYFQLWLSQTKKRAPESYALLAPAVFVNYFSLVRQLSKFLPSKFFILSQMPRMFRRYDKLFIWEYRLLLEGVEAFSKITLPMAPSLVAIDPKDELVSGPKVLSYYQALGSKTLEIQRNDLRKGLGQHHIVFHRDYFSPEEWKELIHAITMS